MEPQLQSAETPAETTRADGENSLAKRDALREEIARLTKAGKHSEAIPLAEKALAIDRGRLPTEHSDLIPSLREIANQYEWSLQHAKAIEFRRELVRLYEKHVKDRPWEITDARLDLAHAEIIAKLSADDLRDLLESNELMAKAWAGNSPEKRRESAELAEKALAIRTRVLGEHRETASSALCAGICWREGGDLGKSRIFLQQAIDRRFKLMGDDHPETADARANFALTCILLKEAADAEKPARQALSARRKVYGPVRKETWDSLDLLAWALSEQQKHDEAAKIRDEVKQLRDQAKGKPPGGLTPAADADLKQAAAWMAEAGANMAEVWARPDPAKRRAEAELAEKALAIRRRLLGVDDLRTAESAGTAAFLWKLAGDNTKARAPAELALAARAKALGEEHADTVESVALLAWIVYDTGDAAAGRKLREREAAGFRKVYGNEHPRTSGSLYGLAWAQWGDKDPAAAEQTFAEVIALRRKLHGTDHVDTAQAVSSLGLILLWQSKFKDARPHLEEAFTIRRKVLGEDHKDTLEVLENLITLTSAQGDRVGERSFREIPVERKFKNVEKDPVAAQFALRAFGTWQENVLDVVGARVSYDRAMAICKKYLPEDHPETGWTNFNLGCFHLKIGDHTIARPYLEKALAIRRKVDGSEHNDTSWTLLTLGQAVVRLGKTKEARLLVEEALANYRKKLGPENVTTIMAMNNLATIIALSDPVESGELLQKALALMKKARGDEHRDVAMILNNLARSKAALGDRETAVRMVEEAIRICRKNPVPNDPNLSNQLYRLAIFKLQSGDLTAARKAFEEVLEISRQTVEFASVAQSERQQMALNAAMLARFSGYMNVPCDTPEAASASYAQVLTWKGWIFLRQYQLRQDRRDPEGLALLTKLRDTSRALAALALAKPPASERENWNRFLEQLTHEKEALERALAAKSAEGKKENSFTPETFSSLLPTGTALVDFIVYDRGRETPDKNDFWTADQHLTAFVIRPGRAIRRVEFGPMKDIEDTIDAWRSQTRRQPGAEHPGQKLRRILWQPLESHLEGATTVLLAPDGALGKLPFAALPGKTPDRYLIEDVSLAVVPVPRVLESLAKNKNVQPADPSLLLIGDVDFDAMPGKSGNASRVAIAGERSGSVKAWQALPGTRGEIETIRDVFSKRFNKDRVQTLRGGEASEASLRERAPKHTILHLATHGFFAPITAAADGEGKEQASVFGDEGVSSFHPGLLSGLVLAGANRPVDPARDDGVLTAVEVTELDLAGVDLAVLSACETGLGKSAGGEGVLGLQRAFQVAGAKTTITSLWSVPDEPTRILMERFYANLWDKSKPLTKLEALREAQLWMLREGRTHPGVQRGLVRDDEPKMEMLKGRLPPYYWAAFVLGGDWR